jgi:hypothetical protein
MSPIIYVASAARRRLPDAPYEEIYETDPPSRSAQAFVMSGQREASFARA